MTKALIPGVDKIPESWVKKEIKAILKRFQHLHYWMPSASQFGVAGQHDFMICQRGLFWSIEAKCGSKVPTEMQILFANDVKSAGGLSIMVNERTLRKVEHVAQHIHYHGTLPIGDDFNQWSK